MHIREYYFLLLLLLLYISIKSVKKESYVGKKVLIVCLFAFSLFFSRTDGSESPLLAEPEADGRTDKPRMKYGELVILG